jgi:hypothetical protein
MSNEDDIVRTTVVDGRDHLALVAQFWAPLQGVMRWAILGHPAAQKTNR